MMTQIIAGNDLAFAMSKATGSSFAPTLANPHDPAMIASRMSVASAFTERRWRGNSAARLIAAAHSHKK
jgi:hypothetical protein